MHEGRRQQEVERTRRDLACGRIAQVEEEARRLIDGSGWDIQPGTAAYHELCFTLLRALLEATMRQAERDQAIYFGRPFDPLVAGGLALATGEAALGRGCEPLPAPRPAAEAMPPTLEPLATVPAVSSMDQGPAIVTDGDATGPRGAKPLRDLSDDELLESFWAEKARKPETRRDYDVSLRALREVTGGKGFRSVTTEDIISFKRQLLLTPANYAQRFKGMSILDAKRMNDALPARQRYDTISPRTVKDKYLANIKALFGWMKRNGVIPVNVAADVTVDGVTDQDARDPFEPDQLKAIWSAPVFTGCAGVSDYFRRGNHLPADEHYWAPLISRFTGLRIGEIGRLEARDIVERHGITCIQVAPAEKRRDIVGEDGKVCFADTVKSANAVRWVPVRRELRELGFLDFVDACKRRGHGRLFPGWRAGVKGYSATLGKCFNDQFLEKLGLKSERLAFHSLRHTFEQMLSDGGMSDHIMIRLLGHSASEGGTRSRYLKKELTAAQLQQFLDMPLPPEINHLVNTRTYTPRSAARALPLPHAWKRS